MFCSSQNDPPPQLKAEAVLLYITHSEWQCIESISIQSQPLIPFPIEGTLAIAYELQYNIFAITLIEKHRPFARDWIVVNAPSYFFLPNVYSFFQHSQFNWDQVIDASGSHIPLPNDPPFVSDWNNNSHTHGKSPLRAFKRAKKKEEFYLRKCLDQKVLALHFLVPIKSFS